MPDHPEHPVAAAPRRLVRCLGLPAGRASLRRHPDRDDLHPATAGLLASSLAAECLAKRYPQRTLILAGFLVTIAGVGVLLALVTGISSPAPWIFTPGLLLIGLGLGAIPARGPCPAGRRPAGAGEPAPATRDEPRAPLTLMLSVNVPLGHSLPH